MPHDFAMRYIAIDGKTAIELKKNGEANAEQLGDPHVFFLMGRWQREGNRIVIKAINEALVFSAQRRGDAVVLRAKNLAQCPEIKSTFNLVEVYETKK